MDLPMDFNGAKINAAIKYYTHTDYYQKRTHSFFATLTFPTMDWQKVLDIEFEQTRYYESYAPERKFYAAVELLSSDNTTLAFSPANDWALRLTAYRYILGGGQWICNQEFPTVLRFITPEMEQEIKEAFVALLGPNILVDVISEHYDNLIQCSEQSLKEKQASVEREAKALQKYKDEKSSTLEGVEQ